MYFSTFGRKVIREIPLVFEGHNTDTSTHEFVLLALRELVPRQLLAQSHLPVRALEIGADEHRRGNGARLQLDELLETAVMSDMGTASCNSEDHKKTR